MTIQTPPQHKGSWGKQEQTGVEAAAVSHAEEALVTAPLGCLSLYYCLSPKVLIQPLASDSYPLILNMQSRVSEMKTAKVDTNYVADHAACRIKFGPKCRLWMDDREHGVQSRIALLGMLEDYELLACADLNRSGGCNAGYYFVRPRRGPKPERACLALSNVDKIRIIRMPDEDVPLIRSAIEASWPFGMVKEPQIKYGGMDFRLHKNPWLSSETSNERSIASRRLLLDIFTRLASRGWTRVQAVDCVTTRSDVDSLVFERKGAEQPTEYEFMCLMLERTHKIRLIGAENDHATLQAFCRTVPELMDVTEINNTLNTTQIKLKGHPWCAYSTPEALQSARLVCGIIETFYHHRWEWHCAVDMSLSDSDKSSFFFRKSRHAQQNSGAVRICCMLPKGHNKLCLVNFPGKVVVQLKQLLNAKDGSWCQHVQIEAIKAHEANDHVIKFPDSVRIYGTYNTKTKALAASFFVGLIEEISKSGGEMLGCADISACTSSSGDVSHPLDCDVFFFRFCE